MERNRIIFVVAFIINILYFMITLILCFFTVLSPKNDFEVFYNAGRIVIEDLPNLYNQDLYPFPWRYLPIAAYFFTPFSLLGLELGYLFFQIFSFLLNILIIYLIYKIIQIYSERDERLRQSLSLENFKDLFQNEKNKDFLFHLSLYLIYLPQVLNYFLGQVNNFITFLILLSLYLFLKEGTLNNLLGGLMLGISLSLKPLGILIIPFIVVIFYDRSLKKIKFEFKTTLLRILGCIIPILISFIYFLLYPCFLEAYIEINLTGEYTEEIEGNVNINNSFSLTRIVLTFFDLLGLKLYAFLIFILITIIIFIPVYILFIIFNNQESKLLDTYCIGIVTMLIVYYDSWDHHLMTLLPFIIIFLLIHQDSNISLLRLSYYLLAFLGVIFTGLFFITYMIFPFNICSLILLLMIYVNLFLYLKNNRNQ